jgi:Mg/Co/Ni transporter MgtE
MGKHIKLFEAFINEDNSEIEYELDRLYNEGSEAISDAVSFLQSYYEEIGEEFDELTINDNMDVEDAITELRKVEGDKQQEAENIISNIENINNQIEELQNELEG